MEVFAFTIELLILFIMEVIFPLKCQNHFLSIVICRYGAGV